MHPAIFLIYFTTHNPFCCNEKENSIFFLRGLTRSTYHQMNTYMVHPAFIRYLIDPCKVLQDSVTLHISFSC